ncbi:hypothetical protein QBC38DRAFT_259858 [Podospora fimiseda]|uniref:Cell wall mannoprotein PIR1-like C-terminal domain-containing protein n=1 Tax=Podospora fimiseda TaxID=252190 RepID=A0AAN7BWY8_9PEZI|nr:hypothetical protein QBC38DRAFT_259858 [Podospora fimiseda]
MLFFTLLVLGLSVVAATAHKKDDDDHGDCAFRLTGVTNVNVTVGQLPGGQVQGGNLNNTAITFHLFAGGLYDDEERGCWWADPSTVLVCDIFPPDSPDPVYEIADDGCLHFNGSSTFYACKAGRYGRVNYYLEQRDATCRPAYLVADNSCQSQASPPPSPEFTTVITTAVIPERTTTTISSTTSLSTFHSERNTFISATAPFSTSISWYTRPTPSSIPHRLPPPSYNTTLLPSGSSYATGGLLPSETPLWQNTTWYPPVLPTPTTTSYPILCGDTTTSTSTVTTTTTHTQIEVVPIVTYTVWKTTHVHTPGGPVTVTTVTVTQGVEAAESTVEVVFALEVVEIGDEEEGKGYGDMYGGYDYGKKGE